MPFEFPPFRPHPLLRGGHVQTLAGMYLPGERIAYAARQCRVDLPDGDALVLHDDRPAGWDEGDPAVLLMHGLAGCHLSPYLVRLAAKLNARGLRTFRLDLRGCGAGEGLARFPYHAGRSDDALAALETMRQQCPSAPLAIVGFSLSGNIVLKLLGECPELLPANLIRAAAVNPPIDLLGCVRGLARPSNRIYDRFFTRLLWKQVAARRTLARLTLADAPSGNLTQRPRGLFEFDDGYTAPVSGFGTAEAYYAQCSGAQFLRRIEVPTLVMASRDDPLIPIAAFESAAPSPAVQLHLIDHGGHLGYIARAGGDPDCRWMDWRVVEWLTAAKHQILPPGSVRIAGVGHASD